jgi:Fe-S-cluster containining protein
MKEKKRNLFTQLANMDRRKLDTLFHEAHEQVFEHFDCLSCANCCKSIPPMLREADIRRISAYLRIKPSDFTARYVTYDDDGDMVMNVSPCPFLESDNKCRIYDHRPLACAEYPHTNRARMYQILKLTEKNAGLCPAIREMLELIRTTF